MIADGEKTTGVTRRVVDNLEPYRRLVRIQKELVKMSALNKQTRRDCDALRQLVERQVMDFRDRRKTWRDRLQQAARLFLRLPRPASAAADLRASTGNNQSSSR